MESVDGPRKACHNCRRQRLRCDRARPRCQKCVASGKECLGYGKLFTWTGAVASRGKLAGRTSSAPLASPSKATARRDPRSAFVSSRPQSGAQPGHGKLKYRTPDPNPDLNPDAVELVVRPPSNTAWNGFNRLGIVLVDPLFQDLNPFYRHYLSYFTQRLCKDLVSYDAPDRNPFRGLLPLTRDHPLLRHIVVAASAAHMSNLVKAPLQYGRKSQPHLLLPAGAEEASQRAAQDALVAKHKALSLMRHALQQVDATGGDIILAAALFFINIELIESGKHGWKAHLEGAGKIMSLLQPAVAGNEALRDYISSDCFIYFILASAFMPAAAFDAGSYFQSSRISQILEKAAANSYLCCPPEILAILHAASQLSNKNNDNDSSDDISTTALSLIQKAQSFDIGIWANDVRQVSYLQHVSVQSRIHTGSAHRIAACLYILQAIPNLRAIPGHDDLAKTLSDDLFRHLSSVPEEDVNFKATAWPTFIAGAEASTLDRRAWVMDRLQKLVVSCPWGFLYTAMDTLQIIWHLDSQSDGARSWVQTLKDPNLNFLIV
ncbi:hypothetical protein RJ55_01662 [Drechmeria coniospora]|nr:hypothetical protein RJ55_01662 [Drechmeria coniospora]